MAACRSISSVHNGTRSLHSRRITARATSVCSGRLRAAITTPFWDAFLTGGVSIAGMGAVLAYVLLFQGQIAFADADWIALTILVNSTHFMASYRLLYSSRTEITAHRWSTIVVPALLFGTLGPNNLTSGSAEQFRGVAAPRAVYAGLRALF